MLSSGQEVSPQLVSGALLCRTPNMSLVDTDTFQECEPCHTCRAVLTF